MSQTNALVLGGLQKVKTGLSTISTKSWKSASFLKVSLTNGMDLGESKEVITGLNTISTGILEVCECPESVTDRWNGLRRVPGGQNRA